MTATVLFPFTEYWWLYVVFTAGILGLLALDLGVFHRDARPVSVREAAGWSAIWISLALLFNRRCTSTSAGPSKATRSGPEWASTRTTPRGRSRWNF